MKKLDYKKLSQQIKEVFLDTEKYQLNKHVPIFEKDGKYVGDFFNFTMFELDGDNPPIFYHNYSPYDIITSQTTDYAAVFRAGERLLDIEFVPYMLQRTGVMTSLVVKSLGVNTMAGKNILYVGTGRIARRDLEALKAHFPELSEVSFVNRNNSSDDFIEFAQAMQINAKPVTLKELSSFDLIICHTNSKEPVLTDEMTSKIKEGAIITTFTSEDFTEVSTNFFDTNQANIIIDWDQTIDEAPELKAAVESKKADKKKIVTLKTLFSGSVIDNSKRYTIYRSHGTPMQNLAALKLLVKL